MPAFYYSPQKRGRELGDYPARAEKVDFGGIWENMTENGFPETPAAATEVPGATPDQTVAQT